MLLWLWKDIAEMFPYVDASLSALALSPLERELRKTAQQQLSRGGVISCMLCGIIPQVQQQHVPSIDQVRTHSSQISRYQDSCTWYVDSTRPNSKLPGYTMRNLVQVWLLGLFPLKSRGSIQQLMQIVYGSHDVCSWYDGFACLTCR